MARCSGGNSGTLLLPAEGFLPYASTISTLLLQFRAHSAQNVLDSYLSLAPKGFLRVELEKESIMKALIMVAISVALLSLTPRFAHAQGGTCCGELIYYHADCGECGGINLGTCNRDDGSTYTVVVFVQCGSGSNCGFVEEYAPAGYCDDEVASAPPPVRQDAAGTSRDASIYVNVYVRDCNGRYAELRMPMARQAG